MSFTYNPNSTYNSTYNPNYNNIRIQNFTATVYDKQSNLVYSNIPQLTLEDIHTQIAYLPNFTIYYNSIGGKESRSDFVERARIPRFAYIFYAYFVKNEHIPSVKEYCDSYINSYFDRRGENLIRLKPEFVEVNTDYYEDYAENCVRARACRAYNSFIREIELLYRFMTYYPEFNAYYDYNIDVYGGVDIAIEKPSGGIIGLATYWGSNISYSYKGLKDTTRHNYANIEQIKMSCNNYTANKVGDTYLYSDFVFENTAAEIAVKLAESEGKTER